jgi:mycothiol synthase
VIGVAAVEYRPGALAAEARVALLPAHRRRRQAVELIRATITLAHGLGAPVVRLYTPVAAQWAAEPARAWGFHVIREQHVMLRPADAAPPIAAPVPGVQIRPLMDGEEPALLQFLNHAWAGTWNFRPITMGALQSDLRGQRQGMLVAVDEADHARIVGTCHAMFDSAHHNPDGQPYAWISNLTTDPASRGRGLGRALLVAGLHYLHAKGASSTALGVDGGAAVPLALYRSVGFATISAVAISERPASAPSWTARAAYPSSVKRTHASQVNFNDDAVDARAVPTAVGV